MAGNVKLLEQVSARTSSNQNTHAGRAVTSTSDFEECSLLSISLLQDGDKRQGTESRTNLTKQSNHTPRDRDSSQDQSNCPHEPGLGDHGMCSSYILQRWQQYSSVSCQTRDSKIIKLRRQSIFKPGKLNRNGKRLATVSL